MIDWDRRHTVDIVERHENYTHHQHNPPIAPLCSIICALYTLACNPTNSRSNMNEIAPNSGIQPVCALNPSTRFVPPGSLLQIRLDPTQS